MGERIVMCPASSRTDQYSCFPGGLVQHSLAVTSTMRSLDKAFGSNLNVASIIKVGLLHDIGKVGNLEKRYFVEQDSSWHREKLGQMYKYNDVLNKMSVSHRTLWLLQHYEVTLSNEEWLAIQLASGAHFEENRFYVGHEPTLALILQQAKSMAIHLEKNSEVQ
jgi:putative nucleotidyltransferase with HDIG domain